VSVCGGWSYYCRLLNVNLQVALLRKERVGWTAVYILWEPEFRVSLMQKKVWVTFHKVGETTQFFWSQKQSNIGQFIYHLKRNWNHIIRSNLHTCIFLRGYLLYISIFRWPKTLTGEELWRIGKQIFFVRSYPPCPILPPLSDLTPHLRSYHGPKRDYPRWPFFPGLLWCASVWVQPAPDGTCGAADWGDCPVWLPGHQHGLSHRSDPTLPFNLVLIYDFKCLWLLYM